MRLALVLALCLVPLLGSAGSGREERVKELRDRAVRDKTNAWALARRQGFTPKGPGYELMAVENGRFLVRRALNYEAAITIAADQIRLTSPYNLSGAGTTIGMWDQALVRTSHVELVTHVTNMEAGGTAQHATSVAGTIAAAGNNNPSARGMAPAIGLQCYEWNNDLAETTARAMATPGEEGMLPLSNHSYDYITGWIYPGGPPQWFGVSGMREDTGFGIYDNTARALDVLAYDAPYYLQVKAAGNDRGEPAPAPGTFFIYAAGGFAFYNPSIHPYDDGFDNGGYDTMPHEQNAKNILVVGAVSDAMTGGVRDVASAAMTSFSSWGPTDDGRVKPDVVAVGLDILTTSDAGDNAYVFDAGTSLAAPAVSGVGALLIEYYEKLFPGRWMRSSTLKGLIIHAADDLGRPGPDYIFGWGLVDAQAAAEQLRQHAMDRTRFAMVEEYLDEVSDQDTYYFIRDDTNEVRVTLCWTDPPGPAQTNNTVLDDPTPRLVHDLDMELVGPDGITNRPWVLSLAQPTNNATTGDNDLDNVEQIVVTPPPATGGLYRIDVFLEGALTTNRQDYSLLVSGLKRADVLADLTVSTGGVTAVWNAPTGGVYEVLSSDGLTGPTWTPVGSVTANAETASILDTNAPGAARFYQLRVTVP